MKTVAIIQARMGSTRLPGKILKEICGKSVLSHVIFRLQACPSIDQIVVATSDMPQDDAVANESHGNGISFFRGSEEDVLSRYYHAAQEFQADNIVRITSDCPLIDPDVTEKVILKFLKGKKAANNRVDYVSNNLKRTFPRGLDTEILTFDSLAKAFGSAAEPYEREHVTPYIYFHPELFNLENIENTADYSKHRWTLDTYEDLDLITRIFHACYPLNKLFKMNDVLETLSKNPSWADINAHVEQKKTGKMLS